MKTNYDEVLTQVTDFLKNEAHTETIIGTEFKLGEFSCVPVIRVGFGFGYGSGEGGDPKHGHGEGGAAGGGMGIEPIGFLVTKGDTINFLQAHHSKGIAAALEKVPDLIEKYYEAQATHSNEN